MDELFEAIYGYKPKKDGTAYEMLAAAAIKLIQNSSEIKHDQFLKGLYSDDKYQIDVLIKEQFKTFLEAKDYTNSNKKVGRPDVQKLAGGVQNLEVDKGIMASATDFTAPAKKYSEASKINPNSKPISIYHIRPSSEEDEKGRIKKIIINIHFQFPEFEKAQWNPIFKKEGAKMLESMYDKNEQITFGMEEIYRVDGSVLTTAKNIGLEIQKNHKNGDDFVEGSWKSNGDAFVKIKSQLIPIISLNYKVPYNSFTHELIVEANGKACLLVKSEEENVDKLITDFDLKKVNFKDGGDVEIK